eukprot:2677587-Amphidinium_carterae.1
MPVEVRADTAARLEFLDGTTNWAHRLIYRILEDTITPEDCNGLQVEWMRRASWCFCLGPPKSPQK